MTISRSVEYDKAYAGSNKVVSLKIVMQEDVKMNTLRTKLLSLLSLCFLPSSYIQQRVRQNLKIALLAFVGLSTQ